MKLRTIGTVVAIGSMVLGSFAPAFAQTSSSSLQTIIQSLQNQLTTLRAQVEARNNAQIQVNTTVGGIKNTLKLISQLREGASGDDVKLLQTILAANPDIYPERLITGRFGALTAKAVRRFQKLNGLDQVGIVGPKTLEKLNKELEKNPLAKEKDEDENEDEDKNENGRRGHENSSSTKGRLCAIVPPGHFIAPGWLRKNDKPLIPPCQILPPGIIWQLPTSTIPDVTTPIISSVIATGIASSSAHIAWSTNEPANSKVTYSTSTPVSSGTQVTVTDSAFVTSHNLILPSLNASTTYYFFVASQDAANNTATSSQSFFTTTP